MKETLSYAGVAFVLLALAVLGLRPVLAPDAHRGVLVAAAVAFPVQVVAFALLVRWRGESKRFLLAWVGGTLVRMALVLGGGILLVVTEVVPPVPTLVALASFYFVLLVLEPVFFRAAALRSAPGPERLESERAVARG